MQTHAPSRWWRARPAPSRVEAWQRLPAEPGSHSPYDLPHRACTAQCVAQKFRFRLLIKNCCRNRGEDRSQPAVSPAPGAMRERKRSRTGWTVKSAVEVVGGPPGRRVIRPEQLEKLYAAPLRLSRTRRARADAPDRRPRPLRPLSCLRAEASNRELSIIATAQENLNSSSRVPPNREGVESVTRRAP